MSKGHVHVHAWGWWLFSTVWALGLLWTVLGVAVGWLAAMPGPLPTIGLVFQSMLLGIMLGIALAETIGAAFAGRAQQVQQSQGAKDKDAAQPANGGKGGDATALDLLFVPTGDLRADPQAIRAAVLARALLRESAPVVAARATSRGGRGGVR